MFRHARTAGFIYQAVLRHELAERLGMGFEAAQRGVGEIEGIPTGARRAFSQRRVKIEHAMADHGARSKRGAQVATLATRPEKPVGLSEAELRGGWQRRTAEIGFDISAVPRRRRSASTTVPQEDLGRLLTEQDATFDRRPWCGRWPRRPGRDSLPRR